MEQAQVQAYCRRVGYEGPLEPTLATLRSLHALHPAAITFENLDVLLGRGIDIAPEAVAAKLIARGRGGYCYEQNGLFKRVLQAIGFEVEGLAARVLWQLPPGSPPRPMTHMALKVTIDGVAWLADVGFGGGTPTGPIRMDTAEAQPTPIERLRLVAEGSGARLEIEIGGAWVPLYWFAAAPVLDVDYELGNWYVSAHPQSRFRSNLIVSRATPQARYALLNGRLTIRPREGEPEQHRLDADGLERALAEHFGLPVAADWRPLLEEAAARPD